MIQEEEAEDVDMLENEKDGGESGEDGSENAVSPKSKGKAKERESNIVTSMITMQLY